MGRALESSSIVHYCSALVISSTQKNNIYRSWSMYYLSISLLKSGQSEVPHLSSFSLFIEAMASLLSLADFSVNFLIFYSASCKLTDTYTSRKKNSGGETKESLWKQIVRFFAREVGGGWFIEASTLWNIWFGLSFLSFFFPFYVFMYKSQALK